VKGLQYIDIDSQDSAPSSSGSSRAWTKLGSALTSLQEILSKQDGKTTTRVVVNELGSADWDEPSSHVRLLRSASCYNADWIGDSPILACFEILSERSKCSCYDHLTPFVH
jgi:hypothetical protein